jgi:decaprenylphospho-beta-D-erythro-pentofuranosid-2-ulose 2-reductase
MSQTVLILGANSDVARALAMEYHRQGASLQLAVRNLNDLKDLLPAEQNIHRVAFDAVDFKTHETWTKNLPTLPDVVVCVFGYLGNQDKALTDWTEAHRIIDTNYTGAISILNVMANLFEKRGSGVIAGISSVAGERGRQSNFIYGSAKAGFTAYLSGLRNRLTKRGVHVVTVKPGFIDTRMTAGLKLPGPLTASPTQVAKSIVKAIGSKRNTIYVLSVWFWIMWVIRNIPEFVFKRLKL